MKKQYLLVMLVFLASASVSFAVFECSIQSSCSAWGGVKLLGLSSTPNAHLVSGPGESSEKSLCCRGLCDLGTSSSGTTFLKYSSSVNSHVEQSNYNNYGYNAKISAVNNIECKYGNSCESGYTCLASISAGTNAHLAECNHYQTKVCCKCISSTKDCSSIFPDKCYDNNDADDEVNEFRDYVPICSKSCLTGSGTCYDCTCSYTLPYPSDVDNDGIEDKCDTESDAASCIDGVDNDGDGYCDRLGCNGKPADSKCKDFCSGCYDCGKDGFWDWCTETECENNCGSDCYYKGGLTNKCCRDSDGDDTCNEYELCEGFDDRIDTDKDGKPDRAPDCDLYPDDHDNDGSPDSVDCWDNDASIKEGDECYNDCWDNHDLNINTWADCSKMKYCGTDGCYPEGNGEVYLDYSDCRKKCSKNDCDCNCAAPVRYTTDTDGDAYADRCDMYSYDPCSVDSYNDHICLTGCSIDNDLDALCTDISGRYGNDLNDNDQDNDGCEDGTTCDNDGICDNLEDDGDGDSKIDDCDSYPEDPCSIDEKNDMCGKLSCLAGSDKFCNNLCVTSDNDKDGISNECDTEADGVSCIDEIDNDGDYLIDYYDDGCRDYCTGCENCGGSWWDIDKCTESECNNCGSNCLFVDNLFVDTCCQDSDMDGVCNENDNCVDISNNDQKDSDNDGFGDACEQCELEPTLRYPTEDPYEISCSDWVDNDCDEKKDCDDISNCLPSLQICGGTWPGKCINLTDNWVSSDSKVLCKKGQLIGCGSNLCEKKVVNNQIYFCNGEEWINYDYCIATGLCKDGIYWVSDTQGCYYPNEYSKCIGNTCMRAVGSRADECSSNLDCASIDDAHTECNGGYCIEVSGSGADQCTPLSYDCSMPVDYHSECIGTSCIVVEGIGASKCSGNSDCASAEDYHTECLNNICAKVSGNGVFECSPLGSSCGGPKDVDDNQLLCEKFYPYTQGICSNNESKCWGPSESNDANARCCGDDVGEIWGDVDGNICYDGVFYNEPDSIYYLCNLKENNGNCDDGETYCWDPIRNECCGDDVGETWTYETDQYIEDLLATGTCYEGIWYERTEGDVTYYAISN